MKINQRRVALGFQRHNHSACVRNGLSAADHYCAAHHLRFTEVRRRVLEILLEAHSALGAYDILERLSIEGYRAKPPVAYRALSFLLEHGFVHRVERLNAFIACVQPGSDHQPIFMICKHCHAIAEAPVVRTSGVLGQSARESGFQLENAVVEAEGVCPDCRKEGAQ